MTDKGGSFHIDPAAVRKTASQMHEHGEKVTGHGHNLKARTRGKVGHGEIGQVVDKFVTSAMTGVTEAFTKAASDLNHGFGKGLESVAQRAEKADGEAAKSFKSLDREHSAPRPSLKNHEPPVGVVTTPMGPARDLRGVDRGDGRDFRGHFTGVGGYGKDGEAKGLVKYEELYQSTPISKQIRVTTNGKNARLYDGLVLKEDGTYEGVEVKSGTATLEPRQKTFDALVSQGTPATGMLDGKPIKVTSVRVIEVD